MTPRDVLRLTWTAVAANRLRSFLTMLGIMIGVASVILLTSLGQGTRDYIAAQFSQFGTNFLQIAPGRTTTGGMPAGTLGTIRKLTFGDIEGVRRVPGVQRIMPAIYGLARVETAGLGRNVFIYGVTADLPALWKFAIRQGQFLPAGDLSRGTSVAVIGPKLKEELFGAANALGAHVRIGGRRFQVIGIMAPKGQMLGFDIDDAAYVPIASAQTLFNRPEIDEIHILLPTEAQTAPIVEAIRRVLTERHDGEEDFTITTQTEMLAVLDRVMGVVSAAVAGIGAISLLVGTIGILTIMWIAVGERTNEIGVAKAIGATRGQILVLFLVESALLSSVGGLIGLAAGVGLSWGIRAAFPGVPFATPLPYVAAALVVSLAAGLASGALPARRAASLDPIDALHAE